MATTAATAKRTAKRAADEAVSGAEEIAARAGETGRRIQSEVEALEDNIRRGVEDVTATVTDTLKAVGVDTDRVADVAREQAGELQRMIVEEIRERPLRAVGLAAAIGLFVGFLSAR